MTTDQTNALTADANETEAEADSPPLEPGMVVVDRDQAPAERDPAVVMSRPPVPAECSFTSVLASLCSLMVYLQE